MRTFLSLIQHVFVLVLIHTWGHLQTYIQYIQVCVCVTVSVWVDWPVPVHELETFRTHWDCGWRGCRVGCWTWAGRTQLIQTRQALQGHIKTLLWIYPLSALCQHYLIQHTSLYFKNSIDTESVQRVKWEKQNVFKDPMNRHKKGQFLSCIDLSCSNRKLGVYWRALVISTSRLYYKCN